MKVFVVGAGAVATSLARALTEAGVAVLGLWGRRQDAAARAALSAEVPGFSGKAPPVVGTADVVIVAVSDEAEQSVGAWAAALVSRSCVLLKCSGSRPAASVFGQAAVRGMATLHPLRGVVAGTDLRGTLFGIEGDAAGVMVAGEVAERLGGRWIVLGGEAMAGYHAAASMASNFLVTLAAAAEEQFQAAGVGGAEAREAVVSLMRGSLENLARDTGAPAAHSLTGPIARGDVSTVRRHLQAVRGESLAESVYAALARSTLALARLNKIAAQDRLDEIEALLEDPASGG